MTKLMGILNVTPDSFFDKGHYFDEAKAIERGLQLIQQGADIIDIGGESSRPGAIPVSEEEELRRVIPVIKSLHTHSMPISIDTIKPRVAEEAIQSGASILNDISGFRNREMRKIAADNGVKSCAMHMQGNPETMQKNPSYPEGIVSHLMHWFEETIELMLSSGIKKEKIILDPGIGFGKTVDDNLKIIHNLPIFKTLGFPLLLGLSRKSFLAKILNKTPSELLPGTLTMNALVVMGNVDIIRVHDVAEHRDLINLLNYFNTA